jgi:hypothetical protein
MSKRLQGGCQCGAVRYETAAAPVFAFHCYCRQCQRVTGAGHSSQFALPANEVQVTGMLTRHQLTAGSGNKVTSAFCPVCGSPVFKQSAGYPQFIAFHAATLDDPSQFRALQSIWTEQRQPWDMVTEEIPQSPRG